MPLRTAKHPHLKPLLQGFKFTTVASGTYATCDIGKEETARSAVASDACEAGSTSLILAATAHSAKIGDEVLFTGGKYSGKRDIVSAVAANTITLTTGLEAAPATGDTFNIVRPIARAAQGKATITPVDPLSQEGVTIVTAGVNVAQGGFGVYDTAHAESSLTAELLNKAGTADDGTGFVLTLGVEDDEDDRLEPYQAVKAHAITPMLLPFKVDSSGDVEIGIAQGEDTLASSIHTIALTNALGRAPIVVATPINATAASCRVTAQSASSVAVEGFDLGADAVADLAMYIAVFGYQSTDEQSGHRRSVKVPQIKPRIEAYAIDGTGTASLGVGAEDGTLTDNGTGDYSVAFKKAFAREPIVLCTGKDYVAQCLAAATTSGFQVGSFNQGAAFAAVDDEIYVLVIGFDDETDC